MTVWLWITQTFYYLPLVLPAAFLLDQLLGDPLSWPHPVRLFGFVTSRGERFLRRRFLKSDEAEQRAGLILAITVPLLFLGLSCLILYFAGRAHWLVSVLAQVWFGSRLLACRNLLDETKKVARQLKRGYLTRSRELLSHLVGRDTQDLSETAVARATIETLAENFSDGVVAPLFWFTLIGLPGLVVYKVINTLDSMVGYKDDRYRHFGRAAARLDDFANWLPARLSAVLLLVVGTLGKGKLKQGFKIWRRDHARHPSPNSGHPESACAGILGVRLGGPASYQGLASERPVLGEEGTEPEAADILRCRRLVFFSSLLALILLTLSRYLLNRVLFR